MTNGEAKIRRTLHFKFTLTGASDQMISMIKSSAPLYQMFGEAKVKLLQNVDDQTRFIQVDAAGQLAHPDVKALIAAAVDQAKVPLPSSGKGTLIMKTDAAKKRPRRRPTK